MKRVNFHHRFDAAYARAFWAFHLGWLENAKNRYCTVHGFGR